jgi:hypothetical protein
MTEKLKGLKSNKGEIREKDKDIVMCLLKA